jgi:hypothetical protein
MSRLSWASIIPSCLENHKSNIERRPWLISAVVFLIAISSLPAWSQSSDPVSTSRQLNAIWPNVQEGKTNLQTILRTQQARPGFEKKRVDPAELATVKIPVLVPEKIFDFDSLLVRADRTGNGYFANAKSAGLRVLVIGSRTVHDISEQSPASKRFNAPKTGTYIVNRDESGYSLGLTRYGIPYTINIECEKRTDARCAGEQYIRSLADSMKYIGGEP